MKPMKLSKSSLAIHLSKLKTFYSAKVRLEQYPTDSEVAASLIWMAYQNNDLTDKAIADLGCGTGILGLGTMIFAPKIVYFVDKDNDALDTLKENLKILKNNLDTPKKNSDKNEKSELEIPQHSIEVKDIAEFDQKVDTIIMNPPFGIKDLHADRVFLQKAFMHADVIYSIHYSKTKEYLAQFARKNNFNPSSIDMDFPIKGTMGFHKKHIHRIKVSLFRFVLNKQP